MSKVTKKDLNERLLMVETLLGLHRVLPEQISNDQANNAIFRMQCALSSGKELAELKPQLKKLDQSVFEGVFDWVKSAAVNPSGAAYLFSVGKDDFYNISDKHGFQITGRDKCKCIGFGYDTTDWQNSLIERDIAKEPAEVDLSSELTGSELCKAMLARGDKCVMCAVSDDGQEDTLLDGYYSAIQSVERIQSVESSLEFYGYDKYWRYVTPINNQGEPLTASEVGL